MVMYSILPFFFLFFNRVYTKFGHDNVFVQITEAVKPIRSSNFVCKQQRQGKSINIIYLLSASIKDLKELRVWKLKKHLFHSFWLVSWIRLSMFHVKGRIPRILWIIWIIDPSFYLGLDHWKNIVPYYKNLF